MISTTSRWAGPSSSAPCAVWPVPKQMTRARSGSVASSIGRRPIHTMECAPRRAIGHILKALKRERLSILLVEQNYHLALQVADRVYVMNKGQVVYEGTPTSLEGDEDVKRRYLGVA